MTNSLPEKGNLLPRDDAAPSGANALDRLASFRVIYIAVFAFAVLYVFSVEFAEFAIHRHFRGELQRAIQVDPSAGPVSKQIRSRVRETVRGSWLTGVGGVRASVYVFGADGLLIFPGVSGRPPGAPQEPGDAEREAERLLPANFHLVVSVPHTSLVAVSILVTYAAFLLTGLFRYTNRLARREAERLAEATLARDDAASRAEQIESELDSVRQKMARLDPAETQHAEEVRRMRAERHALQDKLSALARREEELTAQVARSVDLDDERRALEDLLEEALNDLSGKDQEIEQLRNRVQKASKEAPSGGRVREAEQLGKRLRTLYKNLEVDDRAVSDLVALRDESMKLKAEESLKRLSDEAENAAIRRKVGGLPPGMPVFELGFAGKGRIYYTHGKTRRFRILCVGAKNTQKVDLEYLSRVVVREN